MQSSSGPTSPSSFQEGIRISNIINNNSNSNGSDVRGRQDGCTRDDADENDHLHNRRRNTNPFLSSWLPPSFSPTTSFSFVQDQDQHHHPLQQYHPRHQDQNTVNHLPLDSSFQNPLLPSFAFSLSSSVDFATTTAAASSPSSSSSAFSSPSSLTKKRFLNRTERALQGGSSSSSSRRHIVPMSDQRPPLTTTHSSSSSRSSSSTSPFASSSNPFVYTPYQPPPTREQQQQEQQQQRQLRSLPSSSTLGLNPLSLGSTQWLDLEPVSPGASTLVGSPVTPQFDSGQSGRFQWRAPATPTSTSSPQQQHPPPQYPAPTFRFNLFADNSGSDDASHSSTGGGGAGLGAAMAARNLAYFDQKHHHHHHQHYQQQNQPSWEPHVSVLMDDISLDSFSPSDDANSSLSKGQKNQRPPLYGSNTHKTRGGDGTSTPQSAFGQSSNASIVTLLAVQQNSPLKSSSSSSTLFGGLLKSKSSFHRLNDPKMTASDIAQQQRQKQQRQNSTVGDDGKVYTNKPKVKQFGKKATAGEGGSGMGTRKALFSNERTFVHWIKFGIVLGSTALTLCNFGAMDSLAFYIGVIVLIIAMSSLGYAATMFHRRDRSLERRLKSTLAKKQGKGTMGKEPVAQASEIIYYDRLGPTILCSALVFAYSINFYLSIRRSASFNGSGLSFFHQE